MNNTGHDPDIAYSPEVVLGLYAFDGDTCELMSRALSYHIDTLWGRTEDEDICYSDDQKLKETLYAEECPMWWTSARCTCAYCSS